MVAGELSITNHSVLRFKQRFPKLWSKLKAEDGPNFTLHLSKKNIEILRSLWSESQKVHSIINDTAHQVYCLERFGCVTPEFYIHDDDVVFVIDNGTLITVLDKKLDARQHIRGFSVSKPVKTKKEERVTSDVLERMILAQDSQLKYSYVCMMTSHYEVWKAENSVQNMYYMKLATGIQESRRYPGIVFFKKKHELHALRKIQAWEELRFDTQVIADWVIDKSAELLFKYRHDVFVYEKEIYGESLLVSWNPVTYQGAILDFYNNEVVDQDLIVPEEIIRYTRAMQENEAKLVYIPANNIFLYSLVEDDQIKLFLYFKSDNVIHILNKDSTAYQLFWNMAMLAEKLDVFIEKSGMVLQQRTIRNQPWQILSVDADNHLEIKKLDDVWQFTPMTGLHLLQYFEAFNEQQVKHFKQDALRYAIYFNYQNRSFVIEMPYDYGHAHEHINLCSTTLNGHVVYFLANRKIHNQGDIILLSDESHLYISSVLNDLGVIQTQFDTWIERQRAQLVGLHSGTEIYKLFYDNKAYYFSKNKDNLMPELCPTKIKVFEEIEQAVMESLTDSYDKQNVDSVIGYVESKSEVFKVKNIYEINKVSGLPFTKEGELFIKKVGDKIYPVSNHEAVMAARHHQLVERMYQPEQTLHVIKQTVHDGVTTVAIGVNNPKRVITVELDEHGTLFVHKEEMQKLRHWLNP